MQRFQKVSKKVLDKVSQSKNKIVLGATAGYVSLANAAPVALPAGAQTDIEGSAANGGDLLIGVAVLIVGYLVIVRMIKRT